MGVLGNALNRPARLLPLALLACLAALFAGRAVPALAHGSHAACVSATGAGAHKTRACAGSSRSRSSHAKVKGHHKSSSIHSKKKKTKKRRVVVTHVPAPAPQPATCEDGSTPKLGAEGVFTCADGGEATCANGAQPTPHAGRPVCPIAATPGAATEWSEASCDDESTPTPAGGGYSCDDGSAPVCEDGSPPTLIAEGSMLACLVPVASSASTGPTPAEEAEGAAEDSAFASSARVASAS